MRKPPPPGTSRLPHARRTSHAHGIRDIAAESALIAGGGRAILLQIANPAIGHGVADHSEFVARPLDRLANTLRYVYTTVYGTPEQAASAARTVNRAHGRVRRAADARDPGYSAFDPELQLWVVATLYDSAIDMHERIHGVLDEASHDRVYTGYAVLGTALQLPEGLWPPDRRAFREYWRKAVGELRVDDVARSVAASLLRPRSGPLWLRAGMPVARLVTIGLLPESVREQFGFHWSPGRQRRFDGFFRLAARVYPRLPRALRQLPRDRMLKTRQRP